MNEIESHTGLFIQAGYSHYEFAHKSLQEFLAAEYVVKLPKIPNDPNILKRIPNELSIAVTLSSNPSAYFTELVLKNLSQIGLPPTFYESFIDRLIQEKPDFNAFSDDVVIALAVLYSLYIDRTIVNDTRQLQLFYIDNLSERFEKFVDIVCKRNPRKIIREYYNKEQKVESVSQIEIYAIKRKKQLIGYDIPEYLYSRLSLIG